VAKHRRHRFLPSGKPKSCAPTAARSIRSGSRTTRPRRLSSAGQGPRPERSRGGDETIRVSRAARPRRAVSHRALKWRFARQDPGRHEVRRLQRRRGRSRGVHGSQRDRGRSPQRLGRDDHRGATVRLPKGSFTFARNYPLAVQAGLTGGLGERAASSGCWAQQSSLGVATSTLENPHGPLRAFVLRRRRRRC